MRSPDRNPNVIAPRSWWLATFVPNVSMGLLVAPIMWALHYQNQYSEYCQILGYLAVGCAILLSLLLGRHVLRPFCATDIPQKSLTQIGSLIKHYGVIQLTWLLLTVLVFSGFQQIGQQVFPEALSQVLVFPVLEPSNQYIYLGFAMLPMVWTMLVGYVSEKRQAPCFLSDCVFFTPKNRFVYIFWYFNQSMQVIARAFIVIFCGALLLRLGINYFSIALTGYSITKIFIFQFFSTLLIAFGGKQYIRAFFQNKRIQSFSLGISYFGLLSMLLLALVVLNSAFYFFSNISVFIDFVKLPHVAFLEELAVERVRQYAVFLSYGWFVISGLEVYHRLLYYGKGYTVWQCLCAYLCVPVAIIGLGYMGWWDIKHLNIFSSYPGWHLVALLTVLMVIFGAVKSLATWEYGLLIQYQKTLDKRKGLLGNMLYKFTLSALGFSILLSCTAWLHIGILASVIVTYIGIITVLATLKLIWLHCRKARIPIQDNTQHKRYMLLTRGQ